MKFFDAPVHASWVAMDVQIDEAGLHIEAWRFSIHDGYALWLETMIPQI